MNDRDIEDLLRTFFQNDAERVPLVRPEWDDIVVLNLHDAPERPRRRLRIGVAAATLLIVVGSAAGLAGLMANQDQRIASSPENNATTTSAPAPARTSTTMPGSVQMTTTTMVIAGPPSTLSDLSESTVPPMTIDAEAPSTYYRFAPDVELAWIQQNDGPQLCWRTPIDQQCIAEPVDALGETATVVVPSSANHTVVLVFDTTDDPDIRSLPITITFTNGETYAGTATWDDIDLDIGILRVEAGADEIRDVSVYGSP